MSDFSRDETTLALVEEFLAQAKGALDQANTASTRLATSDGTDPSVGEAHKALHGLKGVATYIGLKGIASLCALCSGYLDDVRDKRSTPNPIDGERFIAAVACLRGLLADVEVAAATGTPLVQSRQVPTKLSDFAVQVAPAQASPLDSGGATDFERDEATLALVSEFLGEAGLSLSGVEVVLMRAEHGEPVSAEEVNQLFRAFHTVKGVAGFIGLREVAEIAHHTESFLDTVREGRIPLDKPAIDLLFDAASLLRTSCDALALAAGSGAPLVATAGVSAMIGRLESALAHGSGADASPTPAAKTAVPPRRARRALTAAPQHSAVAERERELTSTPVPGHIPTAPQPQPALAAVPPLPPGSKAVAARAALRETLKVDVERIDTFVELIGELITLQAMVAHAPEIAALHAPRVTGQLAQLSRLTRTLQDQALRLRMVPLQGMFQKLQRMVRELSKQTGKNVHLATSGDNIEMDRSMVEQLHDPLVHMMRNSVDHAIESAAERVAAGKNEQATIRLCASQQGGSIVIELSDDGRGLNRTKILAKAVEKGLVPASANLAPEAIDQLIFAPGFSTAAAVSELSGRGVGMDVVKKAIDGMRGRVDLTTTPGRGTEFKLRLPLTLAVIDGLVVASRGASYVVPTVSVLGTLRPAVGAIRSVRGQDEVLELRGEVIPIIRLASMLSCPDETGEDSIGAPRDAIVVVAEVDSRKVGLLVDDVLAHQQVVIKPLDDNYARSRLFAGAAILASGRIGLILHLDNLVAARSQPGQADAA